jgi:hypothetical protein
MRPPRSGRIRLCCHGAREFGQAAVACPKQRNMKPDSERTRSGGHEAGEVESVSRAGKSGVQSQGESGGGARRGGAASQEEMRSRRMGFQGEPTLVCPTK